ncbi:MAG: low temperature requirement protein A [Solirubrobacteraceae bacterium]|jgi:low temperature requirement protein LtrA
MSANEPAAPSAEPLADEPGDEERVTSPVELLWDLVFVFSVTQVTTLLARDLSWSGVGRASLVLALIWWAWSAFVWVANAHDANSLTLRATLLPALLLIFIVGLAIPRAFASDALLFAATYAGVRFMHLALYADASRRGRASWQAIAGFAVTVTIGMALLIVGALLDSAARIALWTIAVAIDYAGPAWLTRERLRGLQRIAVAHFAERYGTFVIICLGESIAAIGLGASGQTVSIRLLATVGLGLLITIGLWWTYFDHFASDAAEQLRDRDEPVLAAADAYSYLHVVLIAGIILFAVGMRLATHHPSETLASAPRLALCGGVALYLVGHTAFRARMTGTVGYAKLTAGAAILVIAALGNDLEPWSVAAAVAGALTLLCVHETYHVRPPPVRDVSA